MTESGATLLDISETTAAQLGRVLRRIEYPELIQTLRVSTRANGPWAGRDETARFAERVGGRLRSVLHLLSMGAAISRAHVAPVLGESLLDELIEGGLLTAPNASELSLDGRGITLVNGLMMLADLPTSYPERGGRAPDVYVGLDSMLMAGLIPARCGSSMIDVCTGAGLLALTGARCGARVVATELSPLAAAVARINAALNGLSSRVSVLQGSYLDAVEPHRVDLVCSNPPFVAVPERFGGCLPFDGGADGFRAIRTISRQMIPFLDQDSSAMLLAGCYWAPGRFGAGMDELRELARANGGHVSIHILERQPVALHAHLLGSFVSDAEDCRNAVLEQCASEGWTQFLTMLVRIQPAEHASSEIIDGVTADRWPTPRAVPAPPVHA